jgi:hypothetical protein
VHRISTEAKWFATSQFCVLGLLVFLVGVMVGYGIDLRLARAGHRRNLVQSERESVEASRSLAELDRARLEATARLQALTQAKTGDTAARGLALDLGRYHWRGLCLDEVFVELAPPEAGTEKPNPYATLAGRAATPEAELQDFIVYLARLPMVAQAVLESVEKNPEPGLSCTFQIRLRLKE